MVLSGRGDSSQRRASPSARGLRGGASGGEGALCPPVRPWSTAPEEGSMFSSLVGRKGRRLGASVCWRRMGEVRCEGRGRGSEEGRDGSSSNSIGQTLRVCRRGTSSPLQHVTRPNHVPNPQNKHERAKGQSYAPVQPRTAHHQSSTAPTHSPPPSFLSIRSRVNGSKVCPSFHLPPLRPKCYAPQPASQPSLRRRPNRRATLRKQGAAGWPRALVVRATALPGPPRSKGPAGGRLAVPHCRARRAHKPPQARTAGFS